MNMLSSLLILKIWKGAITKAGLETGKGEKILPSFQERSSPVYTLRAQLEPNAQNSKPINCVVLRCLICSNLVKY